MTSRLALVGVFVVLTIGTIAFIACDNPRSGYYWWDETNDVWCYTYSDGSTECDTPHSGDDGGPSYSNPGHNGGGGDSDMTGGGDSGTIGGGDNDGSGGDGTTGGGDDGNTGGDDGSGGDGATGGDGGSGGDGTSGGDGGDNGGGGTTAECSDYGDGTRYCVVLDGDHICEYYYDAEGNITGTCAALNSECSTEPDGGLKCTFEEDDGTQCIVVFDSTGTVTFDPCHYFHPAGQASN